MTGVGTSNCRRRGWSSVGSRAPRFSARGSGPWDGRVSSSGVVFHPIRRLGRPGFRSYALSKACGHWGFCPLCTRRGFLLVALVRPGDTSVTLLPKAQRTVGSGLRWRAEAERGIRKLTGAWFLPAWTCPALHGGGSEHSAGACGAAGSGPRATRSPQQPFETGVALSLCRAGIAIRVFWL